MNDNDAKRAIVAKTNEVVALARRLFPSYSIFLAPTPNIKFDIRGRSRGGFARGSTELHYNLDWYHADPAAYLNDIIPHEVAHIVATATKLGQGHNAGWRRICLALGGNGKRCNNSQDVKAVRKARQTNEYLYRTHIGTDAWVGPVHHNRLQSRGDIGYALRSHRGERITKDGFTGKSRLKA